jgi:signal recognition particle GTPase
MSNYNFSTINDKEFESLVLDILNTEFKLNLQEFKVGKDGGIDLRFSSEKNKNSIIVQAKHYIKSGYSQLKSALKNKELPKVKKLHPDRYIIATSLELSATEKDELVTMFYPYILTANDIFSNQDLNKFLRKHKEIVKTHFKLWFSNIEIISNILNNAIEGRTKSYLERIIKKIPLYVLTKNFDSANKILQKEKVLLITGEPGVGKTTLAEVLLYKKAKDKFKIYLISNIREAEDSLAPNKVGVLFLFSNNYF